jgi:hypothetical protein
MLCVRCERAPHSRTLTAGIGGFAWGAAVGVAKRQPVRACVQTALRTGAISTFIPFYFVGVLLNVYLHQRKRLDTTAALVAWDTLLMASLYPVFPLIKHVDAAFPHWVGGHVVGFAGYMTRLVRTDNDILKNRDELQRK